MKARSSLNFDGVMVHVSHVHGRFGCLVRRFVRLRHAQKTLAKMQRLSPMLPGGHEGSFRAAEEPGGKVKASSRAFLLYSSSSGCA